MQEVKIRQIYSKAESDIWIVTEVISEPTIILQNLETKEFLKMKVDSPEFKQYKKYNKSSV